jgi:hypothetical protein
MNATLYSKLSDVRSTIVIGTDGNLLNLIRRNSSNPGRRKWVGGNFCQFVYSP